MQSVMCASQGGGLDGSIWCKAHVGPETTAESTGLEMKRGSTGLDGDEGEVPEIAQKQLRPHRSQRLPPVDVVQHRLHRHPHVGVTPESGPRLWGNSIARYPAVCVCAGTCVCVRTCVRGWVRGWQGSS